MPRRPRNIYGKATQEASTEHEEIGDQSGQDVQRRRFPKRLLAGIAVGGVIAAGASIAAPLAAHATTLPPPKGTKSHSVYVATVPRLDGSYSPTIQALYEDGTPIGSPIASGMNPQATTTNGPGGRQICG